MSEQTTPQTETPPQSEIAQQAPQDFAAQAEGKPPGLIAEFVDFLLHNKKWWLTPIILVLLLLTVIIVLSGTAIAPFIYTIG